MCVAFVFIVLLALNAFILAAIFTKNKTKFIVSVFSYGFMGVFFNINLISWNKRV